LKRGFDIIPAPPELILYQLLKVAETSPGNCIAVALQMLAYNLYVSLLFRIGISRGDKKA
jgi:hypothetical protein